jgi:hypothetical protein
MLGFMGRAPSPGMVAALRASGEKVSVDPALMVMVLGDPTVQCVNSSVEINRSGAGLEAADAL